MNMRTELKRQRRERCDVGKRVGNRIEVVGDTCYMYIISKGIGYTVTFDTADLDIVRQHTWHIHAASNTHYVQTCCGAYGHRSTVRLHTLLLRPPVGFVVDHINQSGLVNTRANLRVVTQNVNQMNLRHSRNSLSGHLGIRYKRTRVSPYYYVSARIDGANTPLKYVGCAKTLNEALSMQAAAERKEI